MYWRNLLIAVLVVMLSAEGVRCEGLMEGLPYRGTSRIRKAKNTYGSHYFLSFSAIPLKRRDGFYKNTLVSLNAVNYGITDHFAVGASMDLVSLIRARTGGPIFSARMQVGGSVSDIVHLALSGTYYNVRVPVGLEVTEEAEIRPGFGAAMGMLTIGNMNNQITVAAGWTHDGKDAGRGPLFNIGGGLRLFANVMLITEHWIFSDPDASYFTHSLGARILGDNLAIDVGLVFDEEYTQKVTPVGLPFLSATLNF